MAGTPYKLCDTILRRLDAAGVLTHVVLIGGWAVYFYRDYFKRVPYRPSIRTRDPDFLVDLPPPRLKQPVDIPRELASLDFVTSFRGSEGHMVLQHPELLVEFLVPERGKGRTKAIELSQLGVNAQPLRYLDMLLDGTITVRRRGLHLRLPHPARFALHKLIVAGRRPGQAKAEKDRNEAAKVLAALKASDQMLSVRNCLIKLPDKWRKAVLRQAVVAGLSEIVELGTTVKKHS